MDGKQEIDLIDEDAKQLGLFWIFAKYIFPPLLGLVIFIAAIWMFHYLLFKSHVLDIFFLPLTNI